MEKMEENWVKPALCPWQELQTDHSNWWHSHRSAHCYGPPQAAYFNHCRGTIYFNHFRACVSTYCSNDFLSPSKKILQKSSPSPKLTHSSAVLFSLWRIFSCCAIWTSQAEGLGHFPLFYTLLLLLGRGWFYCLLTASCSCRLLKN